MNAIGERPMNRWRAAMSEDSFEFEKLEVYRLAIDLMVVIARVLRQLPRGYGDLGDHLHRSGRSIHLNIAEGSGKYSGRAKAQRYGTARASANECAAAIEEARLFDLADRKSLDEARDLLNRICGMLTRLIIRWEQRP
jgi:four helix bundle protein